MSTQQESTPKSNPKRLTTPQLEFLRELHAFDGDLRQAAMNKMVRSRTLYRWLKNPVFQEHLQDMYNTFIWHAVFEAARLLPKAIMNLHVAMCSHKDNVSCKACTDGLRLAMKLLNKGPGSTNMLDIVNNWPMQQNVQLLSKITNHAAKLPKMQNPAQFDTVSHTPKTPKTKLPPPKTRNDNKFKKNVIPTTNGRRDLLKKKNSN